MTPNDPNFTTVALEDFQAVVKIINPGQPVYLAAIPKVPERTGHTPFRFFLMEIPLEAPPVTLTPQGEGFTLASVAVGEASYNPKAQVTLKWNPGQTPNELAQARIEQALGEVTQLRLSLQPMHQFTLAVMFALPDLKRLMEEATMLDLVHEGTRYCALVTRGVKVMLVEVLPDSPAILPRDPHSFVFSTGDPLGVFTMDEEHSKIVSTMPIEGKEKLFYILLGLAASQLRFEHMPSDKMAQA